MQDEKPKYGWYVKNLIIAFTSIGLIGIFLIISAFIFQAFFSILLTSGIIILILFLWPGVGMTTMNIVLRSRITDTIEMPSFTVVSSPQILDVGCGTGRTAIKIAKTLDNGGHLTGIDIYNKNAIGGNALDTVNNNAKLEGIDKRTTFQYGSVTEIPFEDNKFDYVNASSVLHEVHGDHDQDDALNEIYRVLKPGGYFYLGEWHRGSWQLILYTGIFSFVFKPNKYWSELVKKHDFQILDYKNKNGFGIFSLRK
jgi:ubiquinone/menaquinone biosynthesis C-methylase UbiE